MTVEIIKPDCNLETIKDGRGGIFTWIPKEPIVEFNMLYFNPGKVRGFHFHPHFIEYLLVVDGNGTLITRTDPKDKKTESDLKFGEVGSRTSKQIQEEIEYLKELDKQISNRVRASYNIYK